MTEVDALSGTVIGSAFRIHSALGPGLFESVYHKLLCDDLRQQGLFVESKKRVSFTFNGQIFKSGFQADLIVESELIVEVKSVRKIHPIFEKQLLTYLRLTDCRRGLLINFNTLHLKNGIKRIANNY